MHYPEVPKDKGLCVALAESIEALLVPAEPEAIGMALLRLQAHYWRPDFTPAQVSAFYADYLSDLADIPLDILQGAIAAYRRDPEAKWFPRTGELLALASEPLRARRAALRRLRDAAISASAVTHERPSDDRRAELAKELRRIGRSLGADLGS